MCLALFKYRDPWINSSDIDVSRDSKPARSVSFRRQWKPFKGIALDPMVWRHVTDKQLWVQVVLLKDDCHVYVDRKV
jgi:hypothetical protein